MKTLDYLRQYFPVMTISLVLLASGFEASAQNRRNDERRDDYRGKKEYRESDRKWKDRNDSYYEHNNRNKYESRIEYHPKYTKKYKYGHSNYFDHPRYGKVYSRFDHNPVVFKHRHGDYYYYNNHFYRYHRGVGYCVVEPPRHVYFNHLPDDCRRVRVNGQVFFQLGDVFFRPSVQGYAVVQAPVGIHISASF